MTTNLLESTLALGRVVATRAAADRVPLYSMALALRRHASGDWGDIGPSDKAANDVALAQRERILSVYKAPDGTAFWIITEWDRSATTILLPEDY